MANDTMHSSDHALPDSPIWPTARLLWVTALVTGAISGAGLAGWTVYGGKLQIAYLAGAILRCF